MALALDLSTDGVQGLGIAASHHSYRYLEGTPVGTQRAWGYLLTLPTQIHRAAKRESFDRVRFLA